ncbi:phospholipase D-like domain-containing protein [Serratia symbiotica]
MGYSFTSPDVVRALMAARRRGVDVRVVVDEKGNRSKARQAATNRVVNAGIPLRTNDRYPLLHDKMIVTYGQNRQVGSFNFTRRARANSKNVLVVRDVPALAQIYLAHWQPRWDEGAYWISSY